MPSLLSVSPLARNRVGSSLHRRFLAAVGLGGVAAILLLVGGAKLALDRVVARQGDLRVADAARRGVLVVDAALSERVRQAQFIAASPEVVAAARAGGARARALGIVNTPIPVLEKRFDAERSLDVDPPARYFLRSMLPRLGAAEMLLTDVYGYNAVTTGRSSDFVQSDEGWWQAAWHNGISNADAAFDSSAHQAVVSLASVVSVDTVRVGVVKLAFTMGPLIRALHEAGTGVMIDVLDSAGHVVLSSDSGQVATSAEELAQTVLGEATDVRSDDGSARAVALLVNGARWRVVAHLPLQALDAPFAAARRGILYGALALSLSLIGLLVVLHYFVARRMSGPAMTLAQAAEAVAAGDFSVQLANTEADDEMGRLSRAVGGMILELRRLASAIAGSARETTSMSHDITAGSEEMAAAAGEMAHTASELSGQATGMAGTISSLAQSAASLRDLATLLEEGAHEGVTRNGALRTLALENRAGLDASTASLGMLGQDVQASAHAVEALGVASQEIRSFVTLVRKLARQSKLLALNAAMEAARAGEHGEGFAVVASEVRRLATMSSEAAERTEAVVSGVLSGIAQSRESAGRAVSTAEEVRAATVRASESFSEIERAVAGAEEWTSSVERTSAETSQLVLDMRSRLDSLAVGTESFAAAMEQVAASSEQQSASTQEIAGAANTLAAAAERLARLVAGLRLGEPAPAAPLPAPAVQAQLPEEPSAPVATAHATIAMDAVPATA